MPEVLAQVHQRHGVFYYLIVVGFIDLAHAVFDGVRVAEGSIGSVRVLARVRTPGAARLLVLVLRLRQPNVQTLVKSLQISPLHYKAAWQLPMWTPFIVTYRRFAVNREN